MGKIRLGSGIQSTVINTPQLIDEGVPSVLQPEIIIQKEYIEVPVEKIIEKPIEVIKYIEKIIEVPVEKLVTIEKEVERIVEVEKIIEKRIEVISEDSIKEMNSLKDTLSNKENLLKEIEGNLEKKNKDIKKLQYIMAVLAVIAIIGLVL
jgi:hypothetical protein